MDLEEDENGIVRLKGHTLPFTGSVVHRNKDYRVTYFAHYQDGKKHGPEVFYYEDGCIRRVNDYLNGGQVQQREWHENGRLILDAEMVDGIARGRHQRWHPNGNVRFDGHFDENFQWDGRMLDLKEDGTVLWDAIFKAGRYVSGVYPAFMQPLLLDNGSLKPEDAVYSEEEVAAAVAALEAEKVREKAEE